MRAGRRSVAFAALGFAPLACAVYDGGALGGARAGDTPTSGGSVAAASGSGPAVGKAGGASSTAGPTATPTAGGSNLGGTFGAAGVGAASGTGGGGTDAGGLPVSGSENSSDGGAAGGGGEAEAGGEASGDGGQAGTSGSGGNAGAAGASSSAGTGGTPSSPLCSDHPLTARATWVASASISDTPAGDTPPHLLDNKTTRWTTGKPQSGDEWLQIDFGAIVTLNHVNLQQGTDTNDYPRSYSVIVSDTANNLTGTVQQTGSGKSGVSTAIPLPALATGRYLLIEQTGSSLSWWSAEELEVSCSD